MTTPMIRLLTQGDYDQWRRLYQGHADFYQVNLTTDGVQTKWPRLDDAGQVCYGLMAEQSRQLIGFAHFRGMPSCLRRQMTGLFDDLFVLPENRSGGVAAALFRAAQAAAKAEVWDVVRWITRDNNCWARVLYNKLAGKTDWVLYEMSAK